MKKILINYANDAFKIAQKFNSKTGMEIGGFDKVIEYGPKDIDKRFYNKNKSILDEIRLGGYALWKPYVILKTLTRKDIKNGDFIMYCDSGASFINKIDEIVKLSMKYNQDIIPFDTKNKKFLEKFWTKRDAFILMNCDVEKYTETPQIGTGFIVVKKSTFSINFFKEFLKYAQNKQIIDDMSSNIKKDYKGFVENRHDQSIFSLLIKKYNLMCFRQPFQAGTNEKDLYEDKYPQVVVSTRKNNRTVLEKIIYQKKCSKNLLDFIVRVLKMPGKKMLYKNKITARFSK